MSDNSDNDDRPDPELLIRAQRYHERAKTLRFIARREENPVVKQKLEVSAADYEKLCMDILRQRFDR